MLMVGSASRATSAVIFYTSTFLLLLVFICLLRYVHKYENDFIPLNKRLFLPFDKRYPEKIASGDVLYIKGSLSLFVQRIIKVGLVVGLLFGSYYIIVFTDIFQRFNPYNLPVSQYFIDGAFIVMGGLLCFPFTAYKALRHIKNNSKNNSKKDGVTYYPPAKQHPYFDSIRYRITQEMIDEWEKEKKSAVSIMIVGAVGYALFWCVLEIDLFIS